ncbi:MAG: tetratricopeptide repeat protein [Chitinophagaceae bacterium]|nr:MAG: tetratricopeptide repeat protein [Chitinophagaceae bacterium]
MKKVFPITLSLLFILGVHTVHAGISDRLFAIKDADERLMMLEYYFNGYDIHSADALQFKNEVMQKGSASEKIIIGWMWEERNLPPGSIDSSIAVFDRYLPAAKETRNPNLLAMLYSVKANALLYRKSYSRAFENYLYAYDNLKKDPDGTYYNQSWLMYNIAMNFYLFKDYSKAIEMTFEVAKLPKPVAYSRAWFDCVNYDLLAMSYLKSSRYDSAKYWLDKTYENAVASNDTAWLGIAKGNTGLVFYEQEQYDKAVPYFESGLAFATAARIWDNVTPFAAGLAHIYILKGRMAEAKELLQQAKYANDKYYKLSNQLQYYSIASLYEKQAGNYTVAFQLLDSVRAYEKKSNAEFELSKRALAESRVAFEQQAVNNALLQEKAQNEKWRFYGLAIILGLLLVACVLLIKRQKLQYSLQQKILQNQKLEAEKELSVALYDIKEFTYHVTEKNRAIQQLLAQVQVLKEQHEQISEVEVEAIGEDMKLSSVLTEEGWKEFYNMYEKAYPGMLVKMREKLPELDEDDLRYLILTQLSLSPDDIAGLFGRDVDSILHIRTNMATKLELTDENEIEILLESL